MGLASLGFIRGRHAQPPNHDGTHTSNVTTSSTNSTAILASKNTMPNITTTDALPPSDPATEVVDEIKTTATPPHTTSDGDWQQGDEANYYDMEIAQAGGMDSEVWGDGEMMYDEAGDYINDLDDSTIRYEIMDDGPWTDGPTDDGLYYLPTEEAPFDMPAEETAFGAHPDRHPAPTATARSYSWPSPTAPTICPSCTTTRLPPLRSSSRQDRPSSPADLDFTLHQSRVKPTKPSKPTSPDVSDLSDDHMAVSGIEQEQQQGGGFADGQGQHTVEVEASSHSADVDTVEVVVGPSHSDDADRDKAYNEWRAKLPNCEATRRTAGRPKGYTQERSESDRRIIRLLAWVTVHVTLLFGWVMYPKYHPTTGQRTEGHMFYMNDLFWWTIVIEAVVS